MTSSAPNNLKRLTMGDRDLITSFLGRHPTELSEFTFTNLFVWQDKRPVYFVIVQESLLFFVDAPAADSGKKLLFGPVFGTAPAVDILSAIGEFIVGATRVPQHLVAPLQQAGFRMRPDRDNADYLYRCKDLAELAGRRYAKKRNHIRQCLKNYHCEYEPISRGNIEECISLQAQWCRLRGCFDEPGLEGEYRAIIETLNHYDELPLIGGAVRLNGGIKAYAIGERLNADTAVWHFEKAMPDIVGLGQLINQWFAQYSLGGFSFVNREQDLGLIGLRQAKESYYPIRLVEKWTSMAPSPPPLSLYCAS